MSVDQIKVLFTTLIKMILELVDESKVEESKTTVGNGLEYAYEIPKETEVEIEVSCFVVTIL